MKNQDIRDEIARAGLKLWQIADGLGINDCTFSRKLRHEFSEEQKEKIRQVIRGFNREAEIDNVG